MEELEWNGRVSWHGHRERFYSSFLERIMVPTSGGQSQSPIATHVLNGYLGCYIFNLKKEVELGDQFSEHVKFFIQKQTGNVKNIAKPSTIKAYQRAFQILQNEKINVTDITSKDKIKELDESLKQLSGQLQKRREEFETISKMINVLETFVENMKQPEKPAEAPEAKISNPPKASSPRMAFFSKSNKSSKRR